MLNIYLYPSSAIQKEKRYLAYILRELLLLVGTFWEVCI